MGAGRQGNRHGATAANRVSRSRNSCPSVTRHDGLHFPYSIDMIPILLIATFILLAFLHAHWAFGGSFGSSVAMPEENGHPLFEPSMVETLMVAAALVFCAILIAKLAGLLPFALKDRFARWLGYALASVFLLRAIGDCEHIGFFKQFWDTPFGVYDTFLYSPLCLLISLGVFLVVRRNQANEKRSKQALKTPKA